MHMAISVAPVWPVNEKGEVVATSGTGSTNVVGFVNQDSIVTDTTSNKFVVVGIGGSQATISGEYRVGQTLTAVPSPGYTFTAGQWNRNGVAISGQTGLTYLQTSADLGKVISFTPTNPVYSAMGGVTVAGIPVKALRAVSNRVYINQVRSATAKLIGGYRTHTTGEAVSGLVVKFANWFVSGYNTSGTPTYLETGSGGPAEFTCQIEYPPGTFTPVLFSGNLIGTAADGEDVVGTANVTIPENTEYKIHSFQKQTGAGTMVHAGTGGSASVPTVTSTAVKDYTRGSAGLTDQTATGNWATAGGNDLTGNGYGPYIVSALTLRKSVMIIGTSIDFGTGGTQDTVYNSGMVAQPLADMGIGFVNAGVGSDSIRRVLESGAKRIAIGNSPEITTVYIGGPVNDVTSTQPVRDENVIFADLVTLAGMFPGKEIVVGTMTPLATAADGQTPKVTVSKWANLNNMIRGGAATYGWKIIDIAEAMSRPGERELCKWGATDISTDGTHPNNAGYARIRSSGIVIM
jgi:lysophospholipase L1-like esterase